MQRQIKKTVSMKNKLCSWTSSDDVLLVSSLRDNRIAYYKTELFICCCIVQPLFDTLDVFGAERVGFSYFQFERFKSQGPELRTLVFQSFESSQVNIDSFLDTLTFGQ